MGPALCRLRPHLRRHNERRAPLLGKKRFQPSHGPHHPHRHPRRPLPRRLLPPGKGRHPVPRWMDQQARSHHGVGMQHNRMPSRTRRNATQLRPLLSRHAQVPPLFAKLHQLCQRPLPRRRRRRQLHVLLAGHLCRRHGLDFCLAVQVLLARYLCCR